MVSEGQGHHRLQVITNPPAADVSVTLTGEAAPPLIAAGLYLGIFIAARRCTVFARPAIALTFELVSDLHGKSFAEGTRLSMWCRLGRDGRVPACSKFARTWQLVAGRRARRNERMTTGILRAKLLRLSVRVVVTDAQHQAMDVSSHYSVVDRVMAVESGGGRRP